MLLILHQDPYAHPYLCHAPWLPPHPVHQFLIPIQNTYFWYFVPHMDGTGTGTCSWRPPSWLCKHWQNDPNCHACKQVFPWAFYNLFLVCSSGLLPIFAFFLGIPQLCLVDLYSIICALHWAHPPQWPPPRYNILTFDFGQKSGGTDRQANRTVYRLARQLKIPQIIIGQCCVFSSNLNVTFN